MSSEVDVDEKIKELGCTKAYETLQLCMADNDRDWIKCKQQVEVWKECYAESKKRAQGSVNQG
eukprot:CAMPEP_0204838684 /NCGR_PEP_ID=MMETSP1346-20131115/31601_1 /ASSEMBLY_ACC=CAM_ASM_000771 /TAXON_ID=215587 /ORGANISM="Aplanochytrium stocchinoi, Strain GSBS06" /LENGTH=62 /DNA_ID=CAMNT_0051974883 /DNA_START=164 /DNA_END=352 /DNA_ORIENTATION=+